MGCNENREFSFLYLMLLYHSFLLLLFHCCGIYWLASARIRPQRRDEEQAPQQCALTLSVGSSLFIAVKGEQGSGWGWMPQGWVV